jgi:basic membrane protein A
LRIDKELLKREKMKTKITGLWKSVAVIAIFLSGCTSSVSEKNVGAGLEKQKKLRVAMVLPGKITDQSWNQSGYEGLNRVATELGAETAFAEQVSQPDQVEFLSDFARKNFDVVIGHGGEFQTSALDAARKYPNVLFLVNNGTQTKKNAGTVGFKQQQAGYLVGYIAAKISKSGNIGFIGGQKIKAYEDLYSGYEAGAKAAKSDCQVLATWTNDWDDVSKGKEAALLQINQGVDVVFPTMDNATKGSLQAAKEKNVSAIGIYYDAIKDWPDTVLQSAIIDIKGAMVETIKAIQSGEATGKSFSYGLETPSAMRLGTFSQKIPESLKEEVQGLILKIQSGDLVP